MAVESVVSNFIHYDANGKFGMLGRQILIKNRSNPTVLILIQSIGIGPRVKMS